MLRGIEHVMHRLNLFVDMRNEMTIQRAVNEETTNLKKRFSRTFLKPYLYSGWPQSTTETEIAQEMNVDQYSIKELRG